MRFSILLSVLIAIASASPPFHSRPFDKVWNKRESPESPDPLVVDLGYERYRGLHDSTTGTNIFRG